VRPPQNVNSGVPGVTAPELSVRLTLVNSPVPVEGAVWNATEPVVNKSVPMEDAVWNATDPDVDRCVSLATVRFSVGEKQRPAGKFVQPTKTDVPWGIFDILAWVLVSSCCP